MITDGATLPQHVQGQARRSNHARCRARMPQPRCTSAARSLPARSTSVSLPCSTLVACGPRCERRTRSSSTCSAAPCAAPHGERKLAGDDTRHAERQGRRRGGASARTAWERDEAALASVLSVLRRRLPPSSRPWSDGSQRSQRSPHALLLRACTARAHASAAAHMWLQHATAHAPGRAHAP